MCFTLSLVDPQCMLRNVRELLVATSAYVRRMHSSRMPTTAVTIWGDVCLPMVGLGVSAYVWEGVCLPGGHLLTHEGFQPRLPPGTHPLYTTAPYHIPLYTIPPPYHIPLDTTPPLCHTSPLPVNRMTDNCKNISFLHASYAVGKNVIAMFQQKLQSFINNE